MLFFRSVGGIGFDGEGNGGGINGGGIKIFNEAGEDGSCHIQVFPGDL